METLRNLQFTVNGQKLELELPENITLLSILRDRLKLNGTKCGCGKGTCGSCTVLLNGEAVRSCIVKLKSLESTNVETIENLASNGELHPLQSAFIERHGAQCGFCTPGMIMSAKELLDKNSNPSEREIRDAMRLNLCRCTGYRQAVEAVKQAAGQLQSGDDAGGLEIVGPKSDSNCVGSSFPRPDAESLVTGRAQFTDDLPDPENLLYLATRRSDFAHAKILSVDFSKALELPGVVKVITAKDIPGDNRYGKIIRDIPVLAEDKVRSYADAIALVVAESYDAARQGCDAIKIEYEELEPLFDPSKSLEKDAPQVNDNGNLLYEFDIIKGDIGSGFSKCDVVVEEEFSTQVVDHAQLEPEAALAYFDEEGKLCVKAPTQHVFFDRLNIIRALGLPKDDVRVIQPSVGGAFGKREDVYGQIHCALAAFLTRRPVRTIYSREETFKFTQKRHPVRLRVKAGATCDGKLIAFKADVLADTGAYSSWGPNILRKICVHISGPYEIPNVRVHGDSVYTNNIFCGAMRGFGTPQAVFASESVMDMLAEKLGIDAIEFRSLNALKPGLKTATGQVVKTAPVGETIKLAADKFQWNEPFNKEIPEKPHLRRGRGIASLWYGIGFGAGIPDQGDAIVEVTAEGKARVFVSTVDYGQGSNTAFAQIAAETLGLRFSDIEMVTGDSDTTPNCGSSVATRQTYITGNAIKKACDRLALDIRTVASIRFKCAPDNVTLGDGFAYGTNEKSNKLAIVSVLRLFESYGKPMRRQAIFKGEKYTQHLDPKTGQGNAYHPIAYGSQIASVTVNKKNGKVRVDHIVACHYVGRAINPQSVRGQVLGGISMGWGYALSEDSLSVDGHIKAENFGRYKMMRSTDVPRYDVILLEDPEPTGPYGAIGVGEPPTVATAPAIMNAIYDAIGVRITSLPATPKKILAALEAKKDTK